VGADFQIVNIIFADMCIGASGDASGLAAALAGLSLAFVLFGGGFTGAATEAGSVAAAGQAGKFGAALGIGLLGLAFCDDRAPAPAIPPAPIDDGDDSGGTYVKPVPECPVEESEGGTC